MINLCKQLRENGTLVSLNLSNNNITISGAEEIAKLLRNIPSEELLDPETPLDQLHDIEKRFYHKNICILQELRLSGNRVDSEGAKRLASSMKDNATLTALYLENNKINEGGLLALADMWELLGQNSESRPLNKFILRIWDNIFDSQTALKRLYEMCQGGDDEIMTFAFNMDIDILVIIIYCFF